jgi:hydroxyacylglutathione hydrolase
VSTIGREKAGNPLLAAPDEDAFVDQLLAGLGSFPPYFLHLAEVNRRGPAVQHDRVVQGLDAGRVSALMTAGAVLVDVRPVRDFAAAHIPGAASIPLRAQFASWLGWLLDPATQYVVVRNPDQDPTDLMWQALKIGFNLPVGELAGGIAGWDGPTTATPLLSADQLGTAAVLDVRQDSEFRSGHVPGATHIELGDLPGRADEVAGPLVVMCGHGERAMTAASVLERAGHAPVGVLDGGPQDWTDATGKALA